MHYVFFVVNYFYQIPVVTPATNKKRENGEKMVKVVKIVKMELMMKMTNTEIITGLWM